MSKAKQLMELATQDIIAELVNVKRIGVTDAMNIFTARNSVKSFMMNPQVFT